MEGGSVIRRDRRFVIYIEFTTDGGKEGSSVSVGGSRGLEKRRRLGIASVYLCEERVTSGRELARHDGKNDQGGEAREECMRENAKHLTARGSKFMETLPTQK